VIAPILKGGISSGLALDLSAEVELFPLQAAKTKHNNTQNTYILRFIKSLLI
jgi:hypothetical protein